jgi:predicted  nucleic acid-binding Zn-ribbon protein
MEAGVIGHADSDIDIEHWFSIAGQIIEDEEDTELAQVHLQKISTFLQAFQADMQNQLNIFNEENARYQMEFQEAVTKENQDLQVAIANANNLAQEYRQEAQQSTQIDQFNKSQDQALNLANAAKAMEDDIADNNSKIQKYSAELQQYQAEVAMEVQEYQQNLAGEICI